MGRVYGVRRHDSLGQGHKFPLSVTHPTLFISLSSVDDEKIHKTTVIQCFKLLRRKIEKTTVKLYLKTRTWPTHITMEWLEIFSLMSTLVRLLFLY